VKKVVILAFEGSQALDIAGPMEVFSEANDFSARAEYEITCVGASIAPLRMSSGLTLASIHFSKCRGAIDTLIVAGGSENGLRSLQQNVAFTGWLMRRLKQSRRIVSVCTGAFVLAELGVLDGRRVSTHWAACERLQSFVPTATVDPDAIFTKDGNVYTSAGITCGIDLALSLVEDDLGRDICARIARNMVLYLRRTGGQNQFSAPLQAQAEYSTRLTIILEYIQNNPDADLRVNTLATEFAISPRHFSRLFMMELRQSPADYVTMVRLNVARVYLEETKLGLKQVAAKCGYGSHDALSRAFRKRFGVAPDQYRRRFV
jgi:transcriptional regulator GlxA family with amidase domain